MDIGQKLKNARTSAGITQETVAEKIGVSRQTISNWETNKCYPDIISVIKLSNLYSISLDILLKEDIKMIEHLDESTNIVRSKKRLINVVLATAYLVVWALKIAIAMLGTNYNMSAYVFEQAPIYNDFFQYLYAAFSYAVMPIVIAVISFSAGKSNEMGKFRCIFIIIFFGIMSALASFISFVLPDMLFGSSKIYITMMIVFAAIEMIISAVGIGAGLLAKNSKAKKSL